MPFIPIKNLSDDLFVVILPNGTDLQCWDTTKHSLVGPIAKGFAMDSEFILIRHDQYVQFCDHQFTPRSVGFMIEDAVPSKFDRSVVRIDGDWYPIDKNLKLGPQLSVREVQQVIAPSAALARLDSDDMVIVDLTTGLPLHDPIESMDFWDGDFPFVTYTEMYDEGDKVRVNIDLFAYINDGEVRFF